jgi:hypothetical protein
MVYDRVTELSQLMPAEPKGRPRHVVFRLSEEEHRSLSAVCVETGVRSLSEFVRQALVHYVETRRSNRVLLTDDLATVTMRLEELDSSLHELSKTISRVLGRNGKSSGDSR